MGSDELGKIVASAAKHKPGSSSPKASTEVLEALDGIEAQQLRDPERWKGAAWKSPYSALVVLLKEARRHGSIGEDGVDVSISVRRLALDMATSKETTRKALTKLADEGIAVRADTDRSGPKAGVLTLRFSTRAKLAHSSTGGGPVATVPTLRAPYSSPRLRWSRPVFEEGQRVDTIRRLGKTAERAVDVLENRSGWTDLQDLADELGIKRPRDFRRRTLARLEAAAVVECSGDTVRLRLDWISALNRRRKEDQELADRERDRKKYAEQSRLYVLRLESRKLWRLGMTVGEIASELDVGIEDVRRVLDLYLEPDEPPVVDVPADGFIGELEPVEDDEEPPMPLHNPADEGPALSDLAVALRAYLGANPDDVRQKPYWLGKTLWAHDLFDGNPTIAETVAAFDELGGRTTSATCC